MENASKALLIAASVLISVMIFSFMWYVFRNAAFFSESTQEKIKDEIAEFNAQFLSYETNNSCLNSAGNNIMSSADNKYQKMAAKELNNIADVFSVVNLVYDINKKNNNDYRYNELEEINSVEVVVDGLNQLNNIMGVSYGSRYLLEPNKGVESHCIYKAKSINDTKKVNINAMNLNEKINMYTLMTQMRDTKKVKIDNERCTIYKYYFTGKININSETQKVDSVKFKLIVNDKFDVLVE